MVADAGSVRRRPPMKLAWTLPIALGLFLCACDDSTTNEGDPGGTAGSGAASSGSSSGGSGAVGAGGTSSGPGGEGGIGGGAGGVGGDGGGAGGVGGDGGTGGAPTEVCQAMALVIASDPQVEDAGGDGTWSPG